MVVRKKCPTRRLRKTKTHILKGTRCYLIGHMQYMNGRSWREVVKKKLNPCGIKFFDPYYKPFVHDIPEDESARDQMKHWMETGQYDLVQSRMWDVRGYDLRLCDICDFFIAHIVPEVASWGSAEEITTGSRPFLSELFLKISAKDVLMTARMPCARSAHGACSRDEPQPKLFPARRIAAFLYSGRFRTNSSLGEPSELFRQSENRFAPNPDLSVTFRKRAGMI